MKILHISSKRMQKDDHDKYTGITYKHTHTNTMKKCRLYDWHSLWNVSTLETLQNAFKLQHNHQSLFRLVTPTSTAAHVLRCVLLLCCLGLHCMKPITHPTCLGWGLCPQCGVHKPVAACSACVASNPQSVRSGSNGTRTLSTTTFSNFTFF